MSAKQFVTDYVASKAAGIDSISIATLVATLFDRLPEVAALFSLIWSVVRLYETRTVQRLLKRWRKPPEA